MTNDLTWITWLGEPFSPTRGIGVQIHYAKYNNRIIKCYHIATQMIYNVSYMLIILPTHWASLLMMIFIILIQTLRYDMVYVILICFQGLKGVWRPVTTIRSPQDLQTSPTAWHFPTVYTIFIPHLSSFTILINQCEQ